MHEQSETVQLPDGRWANVYGGGLLKAGQRLPGSPTYATLDEAVAAARDRSLGFNETRSQDTSYAPYLLDVAPDYKWGRMRAGMLPTDPMHAVIAPLEHREFARETVGQNPLMAGPLAAGIPLWTLLKALGMLPKGERDPSPASLDEIFAGYEGLFSGLKDNVRPKRKPKED